MNYLKAIDFGINSLKQKKTKNYNLDSELLLAKVLNLTREELLINLNKKIQKNIFIKYKKLIKRRVKKEPIAYLLKKKEFWKYIFYVNKDVLIPRPETELIIEETLKLIRPESSKRLLDVGTGSGCIIISLINERPKCNGIAIDISRKALKIAKFNAKMHHLQNKINFANMNIDKFNDYKYDLILSNPPYITKQDLSRLDDDVRFYEPYLALEAGVDGLREIKKLILKSKYLLKTNGRLIFEIGKDQMEYSKYLLKINGFRINKVSKDLNLIPRVIVATKII